MKVWVVIDRDRNLDVVDVKVYKNKPNWDQDFYESHREYEVIEN